MNWPEVAFVGILVAGFLVFMAMVIFGKVGASFHYKSTPSPVERLTRDFVRRSRRSDVRFDRLLDALSRSSNYQVKITRTYGHVDPNPTPLVTPPPAPDPKDSQPN